MPDLISRPIKIAALVAGLSLTAETAAFAQEATPKDDRLQVIEETGGALERVVEEQKVTEQRALELKAEIETLKKDRATITNALIQAAKTEKRLTTDIIDLEGRIEDLSGRADGIRASLRERRALLAEVLAGLQRMGLNPPPALLVKPEDAMSSVRSSILLAAVVPEMRVQTRILLDDLNELAAVRQSLDDERVRLDETRIAQRDEQARLSLLVEEKREIEGRTLDQLAAEQKRAAELAAQARSLEGLIGDLEAQIEVDLLAAEQARQAAERARLQAEAEAERKRIEAAQAEIEAERQQALAEAEEAEQRVAALRRAEQLEAARPRLEPDKPFSQLVKSLARPVGGRTITAFGRDDGLGAISNGETVEARAGAIVTAPAQATVLYAGPFRAYGQLLILDVGDGYHVVLAGMSSLDVSTGQTMVAGEPVGVMGAIKLASVSAAAIQNDNPTLYIEFRKNGKPVDPSPWWEQAATGRT